MNKELVPLKKKIDVLANQATGLVIKSDDDLKLAVEILSQVNHYADSVKEKKELLTKPLNLALKNARAMFSPLEDIYTEATESLRAKMAQYQTQKVLERKEAEVKIANRVKEGKGGITVETAVKKLEALKIVEKEVSTNAGLVQFRESKILKIVDISLIPREYLVVNESQLLKALKEGKNVEGAILETIQVPVNYR